MKTVDFSCSFAKPLTTGVDKFVGALGNDTFNAVLGTGATLPPLDSIDGSGGINTLNVSDVSGGTPLPAGLTVSNIQIINEASVGGVSLDGNALVTGLKALKVTNSFGVDIINGAATIAISVNDAALAGGTTSISGGSIINATITGVTTAGAVNIGSAATAGAIVATVTDANTGRANVTGSTITVVGGTTVNLTQNIAAATSTTGAPGAAYTATGGNIVVNGGAATTCRHCNPNCSSYRCGWYNRWCSRCWRYR